MKTKQLLPNKPSQILEVALRDLETVEKMKKKFKINMATWFVPSKSYYDGSASYKVCQVCHAGAVMACTLNSKTDGFYSKDPSVFDFQTAAKLRFINSIRTGAIIDGLEELKDASAVTPLQVEKVRMILGDDTDQYLTPTSKVPPLSANYVGGIKEKRAYKKYIRFVADTLASIGL